jgi:hypothetical protein
VVVRIERSERIERILHHPQQARELIAVISPFLSVPIRSIRIHLC